jgi:hypothetical protein
MSQKEGKMRLRSYAPNFLSLLAVARVSDISSTDEKMPGSPFVHSISEQPLQSLPKTQGGLDEALQ